MNEETITVPPLDIYEQLIAKLFEECTDQNTEFDSSSSQSLYYEQIKVLLIYLKRKGSKPNFCVDLFRFIINNAGMLAHLQFFNNVLDNSIEIALLAIDDHFSHKTLLEESRKFVRYLASLKLNQNSALEETAGLIGKLIGNLFRKDIENGERRLSEAFLNELGELLPFEPATSDTYTNGTHLLCPTVVPLYGTLALYCQDDILTELCMKALMSQFEKGVYGSRTRLFFDQFNLLAGGTSVDSFNKSLEVYQKMYLEYEKDEYLIAEITKGLLGLVSFCSKQNNKLEVIAFDLLRLFADKGLKLLEVYTNIHEPPKVLEYLLAPISLALENLKYIESQTKTQIIDIFQEFWFVLIYFGYQPKLRWSEGWKQYVSIIAISTPVLIKEHYFGQHIGERFQALLGRNVNPQLKAHLITYMPNCVSQNISLLSTGHCLWLLSFYHSEMFKFSVGQFDDLLKYLTSQTIEELALFPYVEDICVTIIQHWMYLNSRNRPDLVVKLSTIICEYLGDPKKSVHNVALNLSNYIIDRDSVVLCEELFWDSLLEAFKRVYIDSKLSVSQLPFSGKIQDVDFCRVALDQIKGLMIKCSKIAYEEFPLDIHLYSDKYIKQKSDTGFKSLLFEVLVATRSDSLILDALDHETQLTPLGSEISIERFNRSEAIKLLLMLSTCKNFPCLEDFFKKLIDSMKDEFYQFTPLKSPLKGKLDFTQSFLDPTDTKFEDTLEFFLIIGRFISSLIKKSNFSYVSLVSNFLMEVYHIHVNIRPLYVLPIFVKMGFEAISLQSRIHIGEYELMRLNIVTYSILSFYFEQATNFEFYKDESLSEYLYVLSNVSQLLENSLLIHPSISFPATSNLSISALNANKKATQQTVPIIKKGTPSGGRIIKLNSLYLLFLRSEVQKLQAMLGIDEVNQFQVNKGLFDTACATSPILGLRFRERFIANEPFKPKITNPIGLLQNSDLLDALIEYPEYKVPNKILMLAPTLSPIACLSAFRYFARHPGWLNYAMRSLESYSPHVLFFYTPQIIQTLRHDNLGFINSTIMHVANVSSLFSHQVIWNCHANNLDSDPLIEDLKEIEKNVIARMRQVELEYYQREFEFFRRVTGISGLLKPYIKKEKAEKKKKIDEELQKIQVDPQAGLYLPSNPESVVIGIEYDSGRPLQSQAKAPFMATFVIRDEVRGGTKQSAIFKVGDDCRQDVLTLQLIAMFKVIWEDTRLDMYAFPYQVVATEPGCGVIEVIPKAISRDQLGREHINNLYSYFLQLHGPECDSRFAQARHNFIRSLAAYSLITYLLAVRDRHNGNIMISDDGHIIHIDFGFILDLCPGGIAFEKSPFKLTAEMISILGGQNSPYFALFRKRLLQGFLCVRRFQQQFSRLAECMIDAQLPCFAVPNNLLNLRSRFALDKSDGELIEVVQDLVYQSTENMRTLMYDRYQLRTNGIPY
jgi:hypothetical protein